MEALEVVDFNGGARRQDQRAFWEAGKTAAFVRLLLKKHGVEMSLMGEDGLLSDILEQEYERALCAKSFEGSLLEYSRAMLQFAGERASSIRQLLHQHQAKIRPTDRDMLLSETFDQTYSEMMRRRMAGHQAYLLLNKSRGPRT